MWFLYWYLLNKKHGVLQSIVGLRIKKLLNARQDITKLIHLLPPTCCLPQACDLWFGVIHSVSLLINCIFLCEPMAVGNPRMSKCIEVNLNCGQYQLMSTTLWVQIVYKLKMCASSFGWVGWAWGAGECGGSTVFCPICQHRVVWPELFNMDLRIIP